MMMKAERFSEVCELHADLTAYFAGGISITAFRRNARIKLCRHGIAMLDEGLKSAPDIPGLGIRRRLCCAVKPA
jgi:hypothetical protein